ncbi:hypothetical protein ACHAWC_004739 [Mediolabrus comicus]
MRGVIKTIASVALIATTVNNIGSASAAATIAADQQQQVTKFSDRFLTSLEEVDANDAAAVIEGGDKEKYAAVEEMGDDGRRLSWWSLVLMAVHPPPPPCHDTTEDHKCPHPKKSGGGSGSSGSKYADGYGYDKSGSDEYQSQKSEVIPGNSKAAAAWIIAAGKQKYHKLHGSVKQRMKIFNGFATECFEGRAESGAQCGEFAPSSPGMQVV